jgi:DNA-binding beta-propeller fold protein YncE
MTQPNKILWFAVFVVLPLMMPSKAAAQMVYAADYGTKTLLVIRTSISPSTVVTIPMPNSPYRIVVTPDAKYAYVANLCNPPSDTGSVSVVDLVQNAVVGAPIAVGGCPGDIAITPDGSEVYTTVNNSVAVIDAASMPPTLKTTINNVPNNGSRHGTLAVDGKNVYVLGYSQTGSIISVIDTGHNMVANTLSPTIGPITAISTIAVDLSGALWLTAGNKVQAGSRGPITVGCQGGSPAPPAFTPDRKKAYIPESLVECGQNLIYDINVGALTTTPVSLFDASYCCNDTPNQIALSPDNKTGYVAAGFTGVLIFDTATDMLNYPGIRVNSHTQVQGIAVQPMNTPVSTTAITVSPLDPTTNGTPVTLTFASVSAAGYTTVTTSTTGPPPPTGFNFGTPPTYYNIATTAMFSRATVCITASTPIPAGSILWHYSGTPPMPTDVTAPGYPQGNLICSNPLTSLSPFAIGCSIDTIPPVTTATLNPSANSNGWNNTDVTVLLNSMDPDGTVAQISYGASGAQTISPTTVGGGSIKFPISTEGMTTVSFFATDAAGNVEAPNTLVVQIDKTPPTVTYNGNAGKYTVDQTISIQCTAVDPPNSNGTHGSGLASRTCQNIRGPAYSFPVGNNTFSAQATDNAGNVGSGSTSFSVLVTYGSLCTLTKQFVESSANYQALPPTFRSQIDQFVTSLCQQLTNAQLALTSQQKAQLIAAYQAGVSALVNNGWLTSTQGAILIRLSQAL